MTDDEMNVISLHLHTAAEYHKDMGHAESADSAERLATEIYEILDHAGYYD